MAAKSVQVLQSAAFARAYKKLHNNQKLDVDNAVGVIIKTPDTGEPKRGDLAGVYVYKFKSNSQLILLGSHENFYRDLKR